LFADDIITIVNSIIIENIGTGSVFVNTGDTNRIVNSLFVNNGDYDIAGSPEVIATVYNNYIDESKIDILAFKNGNILGGNLDFVDQTNEDYHIGENSVLIDAGTTSISDITFPTTDFDGNDRIMGVAIDIGPYEFITSSCDFFTIPNLNGSSAIICL